MLTDCYKAASASVGGVNKFTDQLNLESIQSILQVGNQQEQAATKFKIEK